MGLGSLFSRFRSEPYYKRCERRLERLENETVKLKARCENRATTVQKIKGQIVLYAWISTCFAAVYASWVYGQPDGTYTPLGSAARVSLIIVLPFLSYVLHTSIGWLVSLRDAWDKRSLTKLNRKRMDMLKDLKETAQFENIFAVIRKFDPEERKKADLLEKLKKEELIPRQRTPSSTIPSARHGIVASTTKGFVANTGKMLMPVLDTLANSVIGDNPALLEEVRSLQRSLSEMQATNAALEMELKKLRSEDAGSCQASSDLTEDFQEVHHHHHHHRKEDEKEIMEGNLENPHKDDEGSSCGVEGGLDGCLDVRQAEQNAEEMDEE